MKQDVDRLLPHSSSDTAHYKGGNLKLLASYQNADQSYSDTFKVFNKPSSVRYCSLDKVRGGTYYELELGLR